jgi:hypothetical protein
MLVKMLQPYFRFSDGDHAKFDGNQLYVILVSGVYEVLEQWYNKSTSGEREMRRNMFEAMATSYHQVQKDVEIDGKIRKQVFLVQWLGSNSSGQYMTTMINCIYGKILNKMCFLLEVSQTTHWTYKRGCIDLQMMLGVYQDVVFGDDAIIGWTDAVSMTQHKLISYMADFGMTYTDAQKSDNPLIYKESVYDLEFLSRYFVLYNGRVCAPLKLETILEMCNWTRKDIPLSVFQSTIQLQLLELALHGKETWMKYGPRLIQLARTHCSFMFLYDNFESCYANVSRLEAYY